MKNDSPENPVGSKAAEIEEQLRHLAAVPDHAFEGTGVRREHAEELIRHAGIPLVFPTDPRYNELRALAYANFENIKPAVIALCSEKGQVAKAFDVIRNRNLAWTPRSGGHSTAGYSSVQGGLMLDLRGLNSIRVVSAPGEEKVVVGPGVQFQHFYQEIGKFSLFAPAGICSKVRVGGFMQGGGYGFGSRMFGINCDNVVEIECVLATGRIVKASATINRDLFWAVRGGTGNNFGVVTEVTYRLFPLGEVAAVALRWDLEVADGPARGAAALDLMQKRYMRSNSDRRIGYMAFIHEAVPPGGGPPKMEVAMRVMINGKTELQRQLLAPLRQLPGCEVVREAEGSYFDMNSFLYPEQHTLPKGAEALGAWPSRVMEPSIDEPDEGSPQLATDEKPYQEKLSRFFNQQLGVERWRRVVDLMLESKNIFPKNRPSLNIEAYGAAIDDMPRNAMAYIHRAQDLNAFVHVYRLASEGRAGFQKAMDFMIRWLREMGDNPTREAYQNYPKPYLDNWERRYFAEFYPLLREIKRKYDPGNFFDFEQGIGRGRVPSSDEIDQARRAAPNIAAALRESIDEVTAQAG